MWFPLGYAFGSSLPTASVKPNQCENAGTHGVSAQRRTTKDGPGVGPPRHRPTPSGGSPISPRLRPRLRGGGQLLTCAQHFLWVQIPLFSRDCQENVTYSICPAFLLIELAAPSR